MYGLGGATKTDELSEKFQTTFDPPPPSPPYAIFLVNAEINLVSRSKICNVFWIENGPPKAPLPPLELFRKFISV